VDVAFLGLGQIGGSAARAIAASDPSSRIVAWTPRGVGPRLAARDGIVAATTAAEAIRGAEVIVLAAPAIACLSLLDDLAGPLRAAVSPDAVISDVASTKAALTARADELALRYVGGHPFAGRETAGYGASDPGLFRGRPWAIVAGAGADAAAIERVTALAVACGARPVAMTADGHDAAAAAISHAPLVLSAALVEAMTAAADWPTSRALAAGGWAAMTRLARGDAGMGAGILATNAAPTADRLRAIRDALDGWIEALTGEVEPAAIEARLAAAAALARDDDVARAEDAPGVPGRDR
jgi:prephenate dehydrogenase